MYYWVCAPAKKLHFRSSSPLKAFQGWKTNISLSPIHSGHAKPITHRDFMPGLGTDVAQGDMRVCTSTGGCGIQITPLIHEISGIDVITV